MTLEILHAQRIVLLDGTEIALGTRAFDVLAHLVANADRVVSKAELLDAVWAGLMVEESNLTVQIAGLRKALGRATIKTVPGIGYRFVATAAATATEDAGDGSAPQAAALPVPDIPSLAVLPFANLTGAVERDYLVDGIVNEVIMALSRVSGFFVISSTSSFNYKGRSIDLSEVGRELGVRYVLEGSIQQAGDQMRIFTQLVEAESGHTLWRDRFDGQASEIFELQDRVAEHVAAALEPRLIWAEATRAQAKPTASLAAYDLCLRAAPLVYRQNTLDSLIEGLDLLRQALALDPDYLQAKALICYAHTGAVATRWWTFEQARAALPLAHEVLDANPEDPLALAYCGHYIAYVGGETRRGLTALQRAKVLNPNSATVAMLLGWVHNYLSENEAAIAELRRARRISPLHPDIGVITAGIGNALFQMGKIDEAAAQYEQALSEYPEFATIHLGLMGIYWALGRKEESAQMAEILRRKAPDTTVANFRKNRPQDSPTYIEAIAAALEGNGFPP
ncbi:tetratricopeptide repeat protein [Antarctobacter heliothermus]|uniref:TolB amino-terminal domain-containing protein n=1 Tax=Antarctobacter heliothermus TaxID=74033 RepID=A0A239GFA8_9RHOB|nr:winged helix-turn-helix domain-containing protein [Antarctobacter heliothermus]SNS66764.1 TolB amino-terminal domain-containing protein [Antarctobacter heliothermus]